MMDWLITIYVIVVVAITYNIAYGRGKYKGWLEGHEDTKDATMRAIKNKLEKRGP